MSRAIEILNDDEMNWVREENEGFGTLRTAQGTHLPLARMDVHAHIQGLFVTTVIEQTFVNNEEMPLEATYIFPLPDRTGVTAFRLDVAGRSVVGTLKERGAARREYAAALQTGHRAAIAEEERAGVFTMRAGNILAGERVRVRLELVGQLSTRGDEVTFQFPLVVAPRYIPGRPLGDDVGSGTSSDTDAVPDASRISPPVLLAGYPNPVQLGLSVDIDAGGLAVSDVRSSLHAVHVNREVLASQASGLRIRVEPGERLNRDFILRYRLGQESVVSSLAVCPDVDDPTQGTFALTIVPPRRDSIVRTPRDVVFVLDRSGSMGGWKMVAARRAVANMVDALDHDDHFNVLIFDTGFQSIFDDGMKLYRATDSARARAVRALEKIEAAGGTEILGPMKQAANLLRNRGNTERVLVLVTDGQVGNESAILAHTKKHLNTTRVFTVGIDRAVNATFLKRLSEQEGGGGCELVESEHRLNEVMASIHRRIDTPLWSSLALVPNGFTIDTASISPQTLPDVFPGNPIALTGRYRGDPRGGSVDVRAVEASGERLTQRVEATRGDAMLSKVWARAKLRDLEDAFDAGRKDDADAPTIVGLSLRFGVMCRFTSFVAVDAAEVVNAGGQQHHVTQPVEMPEGWAGAAPASRGGGVAKRMAAPTMARRARASVDAAPSAAAPSAPSPVLESQFGELDAFDEDTLDGVSNNAEVYSMRLDAEEVPAESPPVPAMSRSRSPVERLVSAGRAILGGGRADDDDASNDAPVQRAEKSKDRRIQSETDRETVRAALEMLTIPPTTSPQTSIARLQNLRTILDDIEARGALGLASDERLALANLASDVRAVLLQQTLAKVVVDEVMARAVEILQAIANQQPLPTSSSQKVRRESNFWGA